MNYYRNKLADELYENTLNSASATLQTQPVVGKKYYQEHLDFIGSIRRIGEKRILNICKNYDNYNNSIYKLKVKFEKLNFVEVDKSELKSYTIFNRCWYQIKRLRYRLLNKKYKRIRWRYLWCLPEDEQAEVNPNIKDYII